MYKMSTETFLRAIREENRQDAERILPELHMRDYTEIVMRCMRNDSATAQWAVSTLTQKRRDIFVDGVRRGEDAESLL